MRIVIDHEEEKFGVIRDTYSANNPSVNNTI